MGIFDVFNKKESRIVSSDGILYSEEEYRICQKFVEVYLMQKGYKRIFVRPWIVTGAIAGFVYGDDGKEIGVEFYMRDLTRGIIRQGDEVGREYQEQVRQAGLILGE